MEVGEERVGKFCAHQKNTPVGLGKAKHTGCCLGLVVTSVLVRLGRPSAQSRQLEGSTASVEG